MPRAGQIAVLLLILGTAPILSSQKELCNRYQDIPLPSEASNTPVPAESPACESYKSYAGIGRPRNYAAAFACAWKERAAQGAQLRQNPKSVLSWVVGGSLILSDLYANGRGTPHNLPLAVHFACEEQDAYISEAFTELESRINQSKETKPFELCDYARSTVEMNFCTSYENEKSESARDRQSIEMARNWPSDHKAAFFSAKKAYDAYVEAVGKDETYMGGTIRTIRALSTEDGLQEDFTAALRRFESGKLPNASAADYHLHDADLNRVFQEALGRAQRTSTSGKADGLQAEEEIQTAGIRQAERAWLTYRDAWVAFATLHYPGTTREAWLDEVTQSRVHRLLWLACDEQSREKLCNAAIRKEIEAQY